VISASGLKAPTVPALLTAMSSPPNLSVAGLDQPRVGFGVTDLSRHDLRAVAILADRVSDFVEPGLTPCGENHRCSVRGEHQRYGAADAGRRAGDDGDLAFE